MPASISAVVILTVATFTSVADANPGPNRLPELEPKPYWIGATASHIAEPMDPIFAPNAAWPEAIAKLNLYKYYGVLAVEPSPDWATKMSVPALVEFCKRNNLRIECEFGSFVIGSGKALGDSAFEHAAAQVDPVVATGGKVDRMTLDGPVCRTVQGIVKHPKAMTLDAIATELARFFALVRKRYPGIQIGLTPNLPNWDYSEDQAGYNGHNTDLSGHTYVAVLERIETALAAEGEHIDFIEVDCPFNYYRETRTRKGDAPVDNARKLRDLQTWCAEHNIEFVLIVNAEHRGGGGQAFHDLTIEFVRTLRKDGVFPDGFLIQSWYEKPDRNLPETEADTFTNTVRDAAQLIYELFPRQRSD
jgi:hypothetical protein